LDFHEVFPQLVGAFYPENALASAMAFDHFARQLARPHDGLHYIRGAETNGVYGAADDAWGNPDGAQSYLAIPNGATGFFFDVGIGGRPLNNNLSEITVSMTVTSPSTRVPTTTRSTPRSCSPSPWTTSSATPDKTSSMLDIVRFPSQTSSPMGTGG
jgi:hypothetical protein